MGRLATAQATRTKHGRALARARPRSSCWGSGTSMVRSEGACCAAFMCSTTAVWCSRAAVVLSKRAFSARANGMTLYTEARNRGAGVADAAHRLLCASHVASAMARELPGDSVDLHRRYCKPGTPASAADMDAASRFAPYAMASYGALYYVYIHPRPERLAELCCSGCCPLLLGRWGYSGPDGGPMVESPRRFVLSKSSAVLNKTAICEIANVARKDLCYVNSENRFNEQAPYFVALDRASKTIVVSIRGTLRRVPARCSFLPAQPIHVNSIGGRVQP